MSTRLGYEHYEIIAVGVYRTDVETAAEAARTGAMHILFWKDVAEHAPGLVGNIKALDYFKWVQRMYDHDMLCLATLRDAKVRPKGYTS